LNPAHNDLGMESTRSDLWAASPELLSDWPMVFSGVCFEFWNFISNFGSLFFTNNIYCTRIIKLDTRRAYKPLISNEDQSVRGTIKLDTLGRTWPCRPTRPDNRVGYSYPDYGMPDPGGRSIRVGRMVKLASFHQSPSRPQQACRTNHKCFSCCWLQSNPAHN